MALRVLLELNEWNRQWMRQWSLTLYYYSVCLTTLVRVLPCQPRQVAAPKDRERGDQ